MQLEHFLANSSIGFVTEEFDTLFEVVLVEDSGHELGDRIRLASDEEVDGVGNSTMIWTNFLISKSRGWRIVKILQLSEESRELGYSWSFNRVIIILYSWIFNGLIWYSWSFDGLIIIIT